MTSICAQNIIRSEVRHDKSKTTGCSTIQPMSFDVSECIDDIDRRKMRDHHSHDEINHTEQTVRNAHVYIIHFQSYVIITLSPYSYIHRTDPLLITSETLSVSCMISSNRFVYMRHQKHSGMSVWQQNQIQENIIAPVNISHQKAKLLLFILSCTGPPRLRRHDECQKRHADIHTVLHL